MEASFRWLFLVVMVSTDTRELLAERPNVVSQSSSARVDQHEGRYYCSIGELHPASMPTHFDNLRIIALTPSVEECFIKCCDMGPQICQYAWLSMGRCMAVACDIPYHCAPQSMTKTNVHITSPTVYIKMQFSALTNQYDTDSPPVPHAGPPLLVHLPQNEVYIYGNGSFDDKGIVKYQWSLIGVEPLAIELEGADTDTLHVTNLKQGVYLFQLSVTDTAGQSSRTGVVVEVIGDNRNTSGTGYQNTTVALEESATIYRSLTSVPSMTIQDKGTVTTQPSQTSWTRTTTAQPSQTSWTRTTTAQPSQTSWTRTTTAQPSQTSWTRTTTAQPSQTSWTRTTTAQPSQTSWTRTAQPSQTRAVTAQPSQTSSTRTVQPSQTMTGTVLAKAFLAEEQVGDSTGVSGHGVMLWRLVIAVLSAVGFILVISGVICTVSTCVQYKLKRQTEMRKYRHMYRRLPRIQNT